jgi:hypothetical protein
MRIFLLLAVAATALHGCGTLDKSDEPFDERDFVTGSNLLRRQEPREPVSVYSNEALDLLQRRPSHVAPEGAGARGR